MLQATAALKILLSHIPYYTVYYMVRIWLKLKGFNVANFE